MYQNQKEENRFAFFIYLFLFFCNNAKGSQLPSYSKKEENELKSYLNIAMTCTIRPDLTTSKGFTFRNLLVLLHVLLRISPYSVQILLKIDQNNSKYRHVLGSACHELTENSYL